MSKRQKQNTEKHIEYSYQTGNEAEGGGGMYQGTNPTVFFLFLTKAIRTEPLSGYG